MTSLKQRRWRKRRSAVQYGDKRAREQRLWPPSPRHSLHPPCSSFFFFPLTHSFRVWHTHIHTLGMNGGNQNKCPIAAGIQWSQWPGLLSLANYWAVEYTGCSEDNFAHTHTHIWAIATLPPHSPPIPPHTCTHNGQSFRSDCQPPLPYRLRVMGSSYE